jgi:hypothetical protein
VKQASDLQTKRKALTKLIIKAFIDVVYAVNVAGFMAGILVG